MTATMIALAVLALHVLFGLGIVVSTPPRGAAGASKPLVFLSELPPPMTSASTGAIAEPLAMSLRPPHLRVPVLPVLPETEGALVDAAPVDAAQVARICGAWRVARRRDDEVQQQSELLVRVGEDGRVLDSRLLVSSGSADRDAALQHCLLTLARLTPLSVEGHAVVAWQRLHPLEPDSSRRP